MPAALRRIAHDYGVMLAGLASLAAIGWFVLLRMSASLTKPPDVAGLLPQPVQNAGFAMTALMWMAMIAAMMAPATGPGLSAYLALARRRHPGQAAAAAAIAFLAGYMAAWSCIAILGALAQWMLGEAAVLSPMGASTNACLSAGILAAAGVYQLTPLKRHCVVICRNPLLQLMNAWRDGIAGALRLGLDQGSWCIGCCWALMMLMFVVGVMNLTWMAALAVVFLVEKLMPARWHLDAGIGFALLAAAALTGLRAAG